MFLVERIVTFICHFQGKSCIQRSCTQRSFPPGAQWLLFYVFMAQSGTGPYTGQSGRHLDKKVGQDSRDAAKKMKGYVRPCLIVSEVRLNLEISGRVFSRPKAWYKHQLLVWYILSIQFSMMPIRIEFQTLSMFWLVINQTVHIFWHKSFVSEMTSLGPSFCKE